MTFPTAKSSVDERAFMAEFTFLELHFEEAPRLTVGSTDVGPGADEAEGGATVGADRSSEKEQPGASPKVLVGLLVSVGLLVALAIAARKLAGNPPEELEEVDALADTF